MKTLFNKGVVSTTVRRIKTLGIVAGIILLVQVVSNILGTIFLDSISGDLYLNNDYGAAELFSSVPIISMAAAFLMTLIALDFLNRRDRTDFYHALPHKRETLLISTIAGVVLTTTVIAVAVSVVGVALSLCLSVSLSDPWELLVVLLNTLAGTFLVSSTVGFVMSITGKRFANIIVSLLVLFLPRALILMISAMVSVALPNGLVPYDVTTGLLSDYNVVSSSFLGLAVNKNIISFLYTMLLGFLFTVLGVYTYRRRKSEMAGVSAPSKKMQTVYRLLVGFSMFSFVTAIFAGVYLSGDLGSDLGFVIFLFTVFYIFCTILYFLFELITTKSWLNVAKAIPGLFVVILSSVLIFGGMTLAYNKEVNFCPEKSEIESISFESVESDYYSNLSSYLANDIKNLKVYDNKTISILREALVTRVDRVKSGKTVNEYQNRLVKGYFNIGSKKVQRVVQIPKDDYDYIINMYQQSLTKSVENQKINIEKENCNFYIDYLNKNEAKLIKEKALEEINSLTAKEWIDRESMYFFNYDFSSAIMFDYKPDDSVTNEIDDLTILTSSVPNYDWITIPVSERTLPETFKLYYDLLSDKAKNEDINYDKVWRNYDEDWYLVAVYDGNAEVIFYEDYNYSKVSDLIEEKGQSRPVEDNEYYAVLGNYDSSSLVKIPLKDFEQEAIKIKNVE